MILLNTHARTGSYLAIQLIINNLIQSKVLSKEDGEANLSAIVNALHGTELPTYFKEIKKSKMLLIIYYYHCDIF